MPSTTSQKIFSAESRNFGKTNLEERGSICISDQKKKMRGTNFGHNRHNILVSALAAGVAAAIAYISNVVERVPYSKRIHFVLMSRRAEKESGERSWKRVKKYNKDKILPKDHPMNIRVQSIKKKVIQALKADLKEDRVWGSSKTRQQHKQPYMDHVGKWEIIVVDDPKNNAESWLAGKIVMYTGLLKTLESDAEIAYFIGHEVAHVVCRHLGEKKFWTTCLAAPRLLVDLDLQAVRKRMWKHSSYLSLPRKLELEADYIGVLLMASAGYDPSIAVEVRKKRAKLRKKRVEAMSTHPSGERRVELAVQTQEEAMVFYKESLSGN